MIGAGNSYSKPLFMKNLFKLSFTAFALLFLATSCFNENDRFDEGNAKVNVFLIDAPAAYDEVWVEVLGIEILPAGKDESKGSAWININNETNDQMVNLLTLVGNNEFHIGGVEVPAGKISQIRLLLGDNNYLVKDGQRIELSTPSAQQSGLKIKLNQVIQSDMEYNLVIDFDAAKSIVRAGNSGNYILKPVLRAVAETAASIQGTVSPADTQHAVYAISGVDTVATFTDPTGFFKLRGIQPGTYRVVVDAALPYAQYVLEDVKVEEGKVKDVGTINLVEEEL